MVSLPGCVLLGPLFLFVFVFGSGLVRSLLSNFCFSHFFGFAFDFIALVLLFRLAFVVVPYSGHNDDSTGTVQCRKAKNGKRCPSAKTAQSPN